MIEDVYVTLETARLLKEKGFDGPCNQTYAVHPSYDEPMVMFNDAATNSKGVFGAVFPTIASAPTQAMALMWLREEKDCPIEILWHFDSDEQKQEWTFAHHKELAPIPQRMYYDTYESACEAAIKYCLEEVI